MLCDAFLAANLIGGTPCGRPEDIEVHPATKAVFIAMTDGIAGSDGYADSRIFQVGKYANAIDAKQPPGGFYKLVEDSADGSGTSFHWSVFAAGGEEGAADGLGFASVDNLLFDSRRNLWGMIDMSTDKHNGFSDSSTATPQTINHSFDLAGRRDEPVRDLRQQLHVLRSHLAVGAERRQDRPLCDRPDSLRDDRTDIRRQHADHFHSASERGQPDRRAERLSTARSKCLRSTERACSTRTAQFRAEARGPRASLKPMAGRTIPTGLPKPATIGIRRVHGRAHWDDDAD